ncbi:DUF3794 domain-containing protein [Inediibacterium massiliense]|uniref:DUF3794 domain-containing protein n=1 Tax=Inediibacterium massiliense TaxID=1658111 RepID=UPI0006B4ADD6|nr:DUF3794 domain-containing protein [Inediibacterium massiliense]
MENSCKGIGRAPQFPEDPKYFKQFSVFGELQIPNEKPDIEQLTSVMVDPEIVSMRLIDTPCMKSLEGQLLSGKKLVIELKLKQKITYVADEPTQSVHAAHFENLKSVFVIMPQKIDDICIQDLFYTDRLIVKPYIEDVYGELRSKRTVFTNIAMLIDVVIC